MAQTLIRRFGQKKAGWALGLTGLVIGTTVFFEAGVVVLIPLAFSVAKQTKKSTLYYAIPLLSGLASGYAFVPPSAGSVLVANALGVNLGTMIMVGIPTALICMLVSGIIWGGFIGNKIFTELPANVGEIKDDGKELPSFGLVLGVIRWMLQDSGLGNIIGPALEKSGLPLILIAFFIAILVRASVGSSIVAMTMASGIMATMPAVMDTSMLYRAAMCCAICGGATALSHVNDAGFWLVGTFLEIDEKTTLKSWTIMETLIGVTALLVSLVISIFA